MTSKEAWPGRRFTRSAGFAELEVGGGIEVRRCGTADLEVDLEVCATTLVPPWQNSGPPLWSGMAAKIFRHQHRVSYAECTVGNHVYYGRYLDLLEEARGEFFRRLGTPFLLWQQQETLFPVIECRLCYKSPARYDDLLIVEVWVTSLEKVRVNFGYRIVSEAQREILVADTFHVCTGLNEKPKRLPPDLIALLEPYVFRTSSDSGGQG